MDQVEAAVSDSCVAIRVKARYFIRLKVFFFFLIVGHNQRQIDERQNSLLLTDPNQRRLSHRVTQGFAPRDKKE